MKSKKLNLGQLKIKSFITNLDTKSEETVKGGFLSIGRECSNLNLCPNGNHTRPLFCRRPR